MSFIPCLGIRFLAIFESGKSYPPAANREDWHDPAAQQRKLSLAAASTRVGQSIQGEKDEHVSGDNRHIRRGTGEPGGGNLLGTLVRARHARLRPGSHDRSGGHCAIHRRSVRPSQFSPLRRTDHRSVRRPSGDRRLFVHTVDRDVLVSGHLVDHGRCVFIDIFSCAAYSTQDAEIFTRRYFRACQAMSHVVDRYAGESGQ